MIREQRQFARQVLESPQSPALSEELRAQATELLGIFKRSHRMYFFLEEAVTDNRIDPQIRSALADAIRDIAEPGELAFTTN